ncbi:MAG: hypothetical protein IKS74_02970 [Methanomicrobium sp.]|nr:hypothetical protein [Methanomicrobium sp.]
MVICIACAFFVSAGCVGSDTGKAAAGSSGNTGNSGNSGSGSSGSGSSGSGSGSSSGGSGSANAGSTGSGSSFADSGFSGSRDLNGMEKDTLEQMLNSGELTDEEKQYVSAMLSSGNLKGLEDEVIKQALNSGELSPEEAEALKSMLGSGSLRDLEKEYVNSALSSSGLSGSDLGPAAGAGLVTNSMDEDALDAGVGYDLVGTYNANGETIVYKIKFDEVEDGSAGTVMLKDGLLLKTLNMKTGVTGFFEKNGSDRVITLLTGDKYTLSSSNVLTTPQGYKVQMRPNN